MALIDHEKQNTRLSLQRLNPNGQWVSWSQVFAEGDTRDGCRIADLVAWYRECRAKYPGFRWRIKRVETLFLDPEELFSGEARPSLGDALSVVEHAESFVRDWLEDAPANGGDDVDRATAAADLVDRMKRQLPALFAKSQPITVAVSVQGGVVQWAGADRDGARLVVIDYDQDGTPAFAGELVDMAGPEEPREEWAVVYEENVDVSPDAIDRIEEKRKERKERVGRYETGRCLECGADLDSPSSAGGEDGYCGPCCVSEE